MLWPLALQLLGPCHGRCKTHTSTKQQLGRKAACGLGGIMLYPRKIQILKLTDAGAHVLIPDLAVLILSLSLGMQRYLKELQPHRLTVLHLLCDLESVSYPLCA